MPQATPYGVNKGRDNYRQHLIMEGGLTPAQDAFVGGSRVSLDFQENLYGHRSGIGSSGVGGNGVQLVATAINQPAMTVPTVMKILSWEDDINYRFNLDNY